MNLMIELILSHKYFSNDFKLTLPISQEIEKKIKNRYPKLN